MNIEIAPKSTEIQTNWNDATLYCFSLNIDGKIGWRLPTLQELNKICESQNDFAYRFYWSSTENATVYAWGQNFKYGHQDYGNKGIDFHVRAIRSLA